MNTHSLINRLFVLLTILLFSSLFIGCTDFTRAYEKVDGEFARAVSMFYLEPDMAPGDTVTLRSVWAGKPIDPNHVAWHVSWEMIQNLYGQKTTVDYESLELIQPMTLVSSSSASQVFEMKFKIPDSIMYNSPQIPDPWTKMLDDFGVDYSTLPLPRDKDSLLTMLDSLTKLSSAQKAAIPYSYGVKLDGLCQFTSVKFRLYCDYTADGGFDGVLDHPVRFHSKLAGIPGVYVNNRPVQTGAKLYELNRSGVSDFDPDRDKAMIMRTIAVKNDSLTLSYKSNHSYFLVADISGRDSVVTSEQAFAENPSVECEEFAAFWMYDENAWNSVGMVLQSDESDRSNGDARQIFRLNFGDDGAIVKNKPFHCWYENHDLRQGAGFRPNGKDCRELVITIL